MSFCTAALLLLFAAEDVTLDRIQSLAKIYLRDSAEVPMSVDVTTVVTDPNGKVKHRGHMMAGMIFHGYRLQSGSFSLRASKGGLLPFGLGDSMSGDLAAFLGGSAIFNKEAKIEIRQSTGPGKPVMVLIHGANCPAVEVATKYLFPRHPCGLMEVALSEGEGGNLAIQHVSFKSTGQAARAKVPHIGDAELEAFHYGVDFQLRLLPGDTKPYLWPLEDGGFSDHRQGYCNYHEPL